MKKKGHGKRERKEKKRKEKEEYYLLRQDLTFDYADIRSNPPDPTLNFVDVRTLPLQLQSHTNHLLQAFLLHSFTKHNAPFEVSKTSIQKKTHSASFVAALWIACKSNEW